MKRKYAIVLALFISCSLRDSVEHSYGTAILWRSQPEATLEFAKEQKLPVVIFFATEWCGYCKQYKRTTLSDPDVKYALEPLVRLYVDGDKERAFLRRMNVKGYPTTIVLNADQKELARLNSVASKQQLFFALRGL